MKRRTAGIMAAVLVNTLWTGIPSMTAAKEPAENTEGLISTNHADPDLTIVPGARIAVVTKNITGGFWSNLQKGMEAAIAEYNEMYGLEKEDRITLTCEGPKDETKIDSQINSMDAVIAENPDALCISAGDMESCEAQLESAKENGIPVIMFDSDVQSDLSDSFVGTDNRKAAATAAEQIAEAIQEQGEVVVFAHQGKTQTSLDRVEGFLGKIGEYPEIRVAEVVYWDEVEDMKTSMQEFLDGHGDLAAVFCTNSETSCLYLEVTKDPAEEKPVFVGFDADKTQQEALGDGREYGLVAQQPYYIGYETIRQAIRALCDADVENRILLDSAWIDRTNLDDPESMIYLEY